MRICTLPTFALIVLLVIPVMAAGADLIPVFPLSGGLGIAGRAAPAADADDYARAEQFLPQSVVPALYNVTVEPHWSGDGPRFWYEHEGRDGTEYVLVDPLNGTRRPAFDHARLAKALANATGEAVGLLKLSDRTKQHELSLPPAQPARQQHQPLVLLHVPTSAQRGHAIRVDLGRIEVAKIDAARDGGQPLGRIGLAHMVRRPLRVGNDDVALRHHRIVPALERALGPIDAVIGRDERDAAAPRGQERAPRWRA
jgi:hypothetical protein